MVRVKYTDHTGCNDGVSEYATEQEARKAVAEELEMTKKMWDKGYLRVLNSPDFAEIYTPGALSMLNGRWSATRRNTQSSSAKQSKHLRKTLLIWTTLNPISAGIFMHG